MRFQHNSLTKSHAGLSTMVGVQTTFATHFISCPEPAVRALGNFAFTWPNSIQFGNGKERKTDCDEGNLGKRRIALTGNIILELDLLSRLMGRWKRGVKLQRRTRVRLSIFNS